jgi:hypothetical protein
MSGELFAPVENLNISGPFHLVLTQDTEPSMVIKGKQQDLKSFRSYLKNGNLTIYCNQELVTGRIDIYLCLPDLKTISTTGPVEIETPTNITLSSLSLSLDEESEAVIFVSSTDFTLNVTGNGRLLLAGVIDTLRANLYNEIDAEITVHSKKLDCNLKDGASLILAGSIFNLVISGSQETFFDAYACQIGSCTATSKGNANLKINCLDNIEIMAVGNSTVSYRNSKQAEVLVCTEKASIHSDLLNRDK